MVLFRLTTLLAATSFAVCVMAGRGRITAGPPVPEATPTLPVNRVLFPGGGAESAGSNASGGSGRDPTNSFSSGSPRTPREGGENSGQVTPPGTPLANSPHGSSPRTPQNAIIRTGFSINVSPPAAPRRPAPPPRLSVPHEGDGGTRGSGPSTEGSRHHFIGESKGAEGLSESSSSGTLREAAQPDPRLPSMESLSPFPDHPALRIDSTGPRRTTPEEKGNTQGNQDAQVGSSSRPTKRLRFSSPTSTDKPSPSSATSGRQISGAPSGASSSSEGEDDTSKLGASDSAKRVRFSKGE